MYYLAEEEQKAAMEVIKSGALFRYWSPDSKVAAFERARDMCPKTLDYLGRAINIGISPFWENANIEKIANAIKAAAKEVLSRTPPESKIQKGLGDAGIQG